MDTGKIKDYFQLSDTAFDQLAQVFGIQEKSKIPSTKIRKKLNYQTLAMEYQHLIENGTCKDRADIARHYGVSRAWITKVMKNLPLYKV